MSKNSNGVMIVGEKGSNIDFNRFSGGPWRDLYVMLVEEYGFDCISPYPGAGVDDFYYGFVIPDVHVLTMDEYWLNHLKSKALRFEEIACVPARLIGAQSIY